MPSAAEAAIPISGMVPASWYITRTGTSASFVTVANTTASRVAFRGAATSCCAMKPNIISAPNRPVLPRIEIAQFETRIEPSPTPRPPESRKACQPTRFHRLRST